MLKKLFQPVQLHYDRHTLVMLPLRQTAGPRAKLGHSSYRRNIYIYIVKCTNELRHVSSASKTAHSLMTLKHSDIWIILSYRNNTGAIVDDNGSCHLGQWNSNHV